MKYFVKQNTKPRGFTMIESLVSIAIFTFSVLGIMVVLGQNIADVNYTQKKMLAAYLAQEGVEYMRNIRDTQMLYSGTSQEGWDDFNTLLLASACQESDGCYFDDQNLDFESTLLPIINIDFYECNGDCAEILYDSSSGKYGYGAGESSGFVRQIRSNMVSANETEIFSTVTWGHGLGSYSITFSEKLSNWIE